MQRMTLAAMFLAATALTPAAMAATDKSSESALANPTACERLKLMAERDRLQGTELTTNLALGVFERGDEDSCQEMVELAREQSGDETLGMTEKETADWDSEQAQIDQERRPEGGETPITTSADANASAGASGETENMRSEKMAESAADEAGMEMDAEDGTEFKQDSQAAEAPASSEASSGTGVDTAMTVDSEDGPQYEQEGSSDTGQMADADKALDQRAQAQGNAAGTYGVFSPRADADNSAEAPGEGKLQAVSAEELLGMDVIGANGDELGEIEDIVVGGETTYVIVASGGFLGLGEKNVAFPLSDLTMRDGQLHMRDITEEEIENMRDVDISDFEPYDNSDEFDVRVGE